MASFVGTFDEFIKYINPRAKNVVNSITRRYKDEVGKCEHCSSTSSTLEAAHIRGRERPKIIEEVLADFTNGEIVTVDLDVFENKFLSAHKPIEKTILVLCRDCHRNYDQRNESNAPAVNEQQVNSEAVSITNSEITEYLRINVPLLPDAEITNLQSREYCNSTFGVNYPVLKSVPLNSNIEQLREYAQINGYNRWSTQRPVIKNNAKYLVMTQWIERHRLPFMAWQKRMGQNR